MPGEDREGYCLLKDWCKKDSPQLILMVLVMYTCCGCGPSDTQGVCISRQRSACVDADDWLASTVLTSVERLRLSLTGVCVDRHGAGRLGRPAHWTHPFDCDMA